jgi:DNA-binding response OmpR family regulator
MDKSILVIDDEPDVVGFLSRLLRDNGYDVITADNATDAMAMIEDRRPGLILLDLQMPYETGTDLFRKLRHRRELKEIPIIVVSGLAGRNVAVSRSVPVIDKPIDEERLLAEVRRAFEP